MICTMVLGGSVFTACSGEDELDTDQFVGGVSLNAFGPSPVARGGQLRFIGSGMNQVTEIVFPGGTSVTDITVVSEREIRVTVPQSAEPGKLTLKYAGGQLSTLTVLAYTEPVGFSEQTPFAPNPVKPGNTLTIAGDYLNLVTSVIFADGVEIEQSAFATHTRQQISLVVPYEAQTGRVTLSFVATGDTIPNEILSDELLQVVLPSVKDTIDIQGSKPGDVITITGSDFDLITAVVMPNGRTVDFEYIDEACSGIRFTLPDDISTGYIFVSAASGVMVAVANNGVAEPADLVVAPATELREGDVITISGKNLDVVTSVTFPGVSDAVALEEGGTASQISVKAPAGFISGEMLLNTGFGVQFPVAIETAKPQHTAYDPTTVSAGSGLTIFGQNLDLVAMVGFGESLTVTEFSVQSASELYLIVPVTATSDQLYITMKNGEKVTFPTLDIDSPVFCFIPEMPGDDVEMKAGGMAAFTVVNGDKLTGVQIDGEECHYILTGTTLYVGIPETAGMSSKLTLISSNGEVTYDLAVTPNTEQTFVIWSGALDLAGWSINWTFGDNTQSTGESVSAFADIALQEGDVIRIWATNYNDWWQIQFFTGHWDGQGEIGVATGLNNGNNINSGIYSLADHGGFIEIPVTATLAEQLTTITDWGYCWIMQGEGLIISKIDVVRHISLETNINADCVRQDDQSVAWTFPSLMTWSDEGRFRILRNGANNLQDFKFKAGATVMRIYKSGTGQVQINNANWTALTTAADWDGSVDVLEVILTQDLIDCFTGAVSDGWSNTALILQGDGLTVQKITLE